MTQTKPPARPPRGPFGHPPLLRTALLLSLALVLVLTACGRRPAPLQAAPEPSAWNNDQIGDGQKQGSATFSHDAGEATITLAGSGSEIGSTFDSFFYAHRTAHGDVDVTVRLVDLDLGVTAAKAGVMLRESLAPGARNVFVAVTAAGDVVFQHRSEVDGSTERITKPGVTAPQWLRLERDEDEFRAFASPDAVHWTELGVVPLELAPALHVGLAITSRDPARVATARFDGLALTPHVDDDAFVPGQPTPEGPVAGFAIAPAAIELDLLEAVTFAAAVDGEAVAVEWSATGGTIQEDGSYVAPDTPGTYEVRARLVGEPERVAVAVVAVTDEDRDGLDDDPNDGPPGEEELLPGEPEPEPTPPVGSSREAFSLRGDPSFSRSSLGSNARQWYDRTRRAIAHADPQVDVNGIGRSGDLYRYARPANEYVTSLLLAFRATGDLRFLDDIDRLLQRMRRELTTSWVDDRGRSVRPSDGTHDLRRWNYLRGSGGHFGQDRHVMDSVMTHAWIANVAYAFERNRDLRSPAGIDYGERADFWRNYLVNDFERIWQIRTGKRGSDKDYWQHQVSHSWNHNVRWLYFMGRLTGENAYLREAERKAERAKHHMLDVSTPLGTAKIWSHRLFDYPYGLQPITYARYDWAALAELHLDGLRPFDRAFMRAHATTLAHFVMDNGARDFSFDVGGMRNRSGTDGDGRSRSLPTRNPWNASSLEYARQNTSRFANSSFASLAMFDTSGTVAQVSRGVYRAIESDVENARRVHIPAGLLASAMR